MAKLIDINLFADGYGYAGEVQSLTPPIIEEVVEEFSGGGFGGVIDIPMDRVNKPEASWVVTKHDENLPSLIGRNNKPVKFRCLAVDEDGNRIPVHYEMRGRVTSHDEGELTAGGTNAITQRMSVQKYTKTVNGVEVLHLDIKGRILRFNGVDVWADARRALGI